MTISDPAELFVWLWLPGEVAPVVAGQVLREPATGTISFGYGRSYLQRNNAIPIFEPDLPVQLGLQVPRRGHQLAPCLRDALPDRWGRRVIINELFGLRGAEIRQDSLSEMTFMLHSGSDRIGALDFQTSATDYVARTNEDATLTELQDFADLVEAGLPVPPALDRAILHGSSIGGARPKALITDRGRKLIAKFSAANDAFAMVKAEFAAMRLAQHVGIDAAPVEIAKVASRDVLLVERFDRQPTAAGWQRRAIVSALTWTGEQELSAHHIAYTELAEIIRARFAAPGATLQQLYRRMVFNVLVGNTDDHARNHAAFWDGRTLALTPAYDIAPQPRGGRAANLALNILPGCREARLTLALAAAGHFLLTAFEAHAIIDDMVEAVRTGWPQVADEAGMTRIERAYFAGRQILNPFAFEDFGPALEIPV